VDLAKTSQKAFAENPVVCYSVFAFVALVSPLGCKAVARSNLRPFFCAMRLLCGLVTQGLKTAEALLRGSELEASDSLNM
jgi:hypothetical protein